MVVWGREGVEIEVGVESTYMRGWMCVRVGEGIYMCVEAPT